MRLTKFYDNEESDFEWIDGKKVLRDGKVLRVRATMMDSKSLYPVKISDGSGDPLRLNRPGFRTFTDQRRRQILADERELDYAAYEDAVTEAYKNTSPSWSNNPPTGARTHNMPGEEDVAEGTACTCRGPEFVEHFGAPGRMKMYKGKMTCVPIGVTGDAADRSTIYDEYDAEMSNAWRGADARRRKEQWRDPEGRETGIAEEEEEEEDEEEDDSDENGNPFLEGAVSEVLEQTQNSGVERVVRRDVPDAMSRARAFGNQISQQQAHRETVMADAYAAYDRELMEQSRK